MCCDDKCVVIFREGTTKYILTKTFTGNTYFAI